MEVALRSGLEKRPEDRPPSALAFARELVKAQEANGMVPSQLVLPARGAIESATTAPTGARTRSQRWRPARRRVSIPLAAILVTAAAGVAFAAGTVLSAKNSATTGGARAPTPQLLHPIAIAYKSAGPGSQGHLYVADQNRIWDLGSGHLVAVAGGDAKGDSGEGGPATAALLSHPIGLAVLPSGDLLVLDSGNNKLKEVRAADDTIVTIAGTGQPASAGDGGPADLASLNYPTDVAACRDGSIYVIDNLVIRRIDSGAQRKITTYAGSAGPTAPTPTDGAVAAKVAFYGPAGLACDQQGTLFLSDNFAVWSITHDGKLHLLAGTPGQSGRQVPDAPAKQALFNGLAGLDVGPDGSLYMVDDINNVAELLRGGRVTVIAGDGGHGEGKCTGPALNAEIDSPSGIAFASSPDRLFIADTYNRRVLDLPLTTSPPAQRLISTVYDVRKC